MRWNSCQDLGARRHGDVLEDLGADVRSPEGSRSWGPQQGTQSSCQVSSSSAFEEQKLWDAIPSVPGGPPRGVGGVGLVVLGVGGVGVGGVGCWLLVVEVGVGVVAHARPKIIFQ